MTTTSILNTMFGYDVSPAPSQRQVEESVKKERPSSKLDCVDGEPIRSLVQRLFLPGGLKSPRQVVFTCVDDKTDVAAICLRVGHSLSAQTSGSVCIVETTPPLSCNEHQFRAVASTSASGHGGCDWLRDSALQLSKTLWILPPDVFLQNETALSATLLRQRVDELRLAFDFTIFQAAPAGHCSDPVLLGCLCDGVVLVLTASITRRVAARKVKERLNSANARLLGTVLSDRKFPIPERIYRML
jgi:hypothetical protein